MPSKANSEFLECLQFFRGTVEGAVEAGFIAGEAGEVILAKTLDGEGLPERAESYLLGLCFGWIEMTVHVGFDAADAAIAPEAKKHLFDAEQLGRTFGVELLVKGLAQFFKHGGIFVGEQDLLRPESVDKAVEPDGCFAFVRSRAGTVLRVAAIGRDLCW